jgi:NADPH-dependent 7-cyano-7-deazaguanine reductase QueF-like protein
MMHAYETTLIRNHDKPIVNVARVLDHGNKPAVENILDSELWPRCNKPPELLVEVWSTHERSWLNRDLERRRS